ncbi:small ribosomal subunit protein eS10-like [Brevipalpus obovatus]|uniref:small ribosomal subunit protein eS10-like n=1 Tax=Brevipalpus obovatus TaxID=246614 RepID=UPI003D9EEE7C
MLMPKQNRTAIYEYLFKEGVIVAKKDYVLPRHPAFPAKDAAVTITNLQVIKTLQSLKSRGYVKEQFAWRHFYWYLTNEGIQYLRDFLHLPAEIVPATLQRKKPTDARRAGGPGQQPGMKGDEGFSMDKRPSGLGGYGRGRPIEQ